MEVKQEQVQPIVLKKDGKDTTVKGRSLVGAYIPDGEGHCWTGAMPIVLIEQDLTNTRDKLAKRARLEGERFKVGPAVWDKETADLRNQADTCEMLLSWLEGDREKVDWIREGRKVSLEEFRQQRVIQMRLYYYGISSESRPLPKTLAAKKSSTVVGTDGDLVNVTRQINNQKIKKTSTNGRVKKEIKVV